MENVSRQTRILVIDDEPDVTDVLGKRLESWGYEVQMASNGEEALRQTLSWPPDLVVCDMNLPDKDGIQVLREIQARGCSSPFLFLTGRLIDPQESAQIQSEGSDFLLKPFEASQLQAKLRSLLKK